MRKSLSWHLLVALSFIFLPEITRANDLPLGEVVVDYPTNAESVQVNIDELIRQPVDGDSSISFAIQAVSDPNSIRVTINSATGELAVIRNSNEAAEIDITVRAEFTKPFHVYDNMGGRPGIDKPDLSQLEVQPLQLLTSWAFYKRENNRYIENDLYEPALMRVLESWVSPDPETPLVFDIENDTYFGNNAPGRDRLARALHIAQTQRPDKQMRGYYRLLPERSWYFPLNHLLAQQHLALGLDSWYSRRAAEFEQSYRDWHARNALYRTEPVSTWAGGGTVADKVNVVYPSLYTFFRNNDAMAAYLPIQFDSSNQRIFSKGCGFEDDSELRLAISSQRKLPAPFRPLYSSYYVVNARNGGTNFQLALSPKGSPIDFSESTATGVFAYRRDLPRTLCQDAGVVNWPLYAEENIKEARKYAKPVIAYISPSLSGIGAQHLEENFFKLQLETLRKLADGIVLYEPATRSASYHRSQGWYRALSNFMDSLKPRRMTIRLRLPANQTPLQPESKKGDVDQDGDVDHVDFFTCLNNFTGTDGKGKTSGQCDTDGDGDVDLSDLYAMLENFERVEQPAGHVLGDLNDDGQVTTRDIVVIYSNFTGPKGTGMRWSDGDFDGDGDIDQADIAQLLASALIRCDSQFLACEQRSGTRSLAASMKSKKLPMSWKRTKKSFRHDARANGKRIPKALRHALRNIAR